MKNLKEMLEKNLVKAQAHTLSFHARLKDNRGDSNLVSNIVMIVVVIVAIIAIFWPQLRDMTKDVFGKADAKIDSVWNYS